MNTVKPIHNRFHLVGATAEALAAWAAITVVAQALTELPVTGSLDGPKDGLFKRGNTMCEQFIGATPFYRKIK